MSIHHCYQAKVVYKMITGRLQPNSRVCVIPITLCDLGIYAYIKLRYVEELDRQHSDQTLLL